jgi:PAS domain S-box-containing protein
MSVFSMIHPDDMEYAQKVFNSLLGEDNSVKTLEFRYKCKDGSYKPIELTAANLLNDPVIDGILLNYRDISGRKAKEEEKLKADITIRILSLAINQSPVTVVITDLAGNIESVNSRFTDVTGYTAEEVIGQNMKILKAGDRPDSDYKELWNTILSGGNWHGIFHNRKKNGELYWESAVISPVKDQHGIITHFLAVKEDITSRLKSEQEIKHKNEELQKLNSEKDKFFSIIAHDLRGPLGGFKGLTEMMADESNEFTGHEIKEMTLELSRSARNTFNLLENLLEWSQMDSGLTEFKPQKLGLMNMVTDCINVVSEQARGKGIALNVELPTGYEVIADKNMLQTVIRNLLSNAIKFTPKGGSVAISAKPAENSRMVISVKDTGIGMNDEMQNNLFNLGANTKRPGTEGEKSTGLGLLLCKEFVEKNGGEIRIESEQNHGTIFSFTIPTTGQKGSEKADLNAEFTEKSEGNINNLKILIAEDDDISAKLIHMMVKGFSREVFEAKTGRDAVHICLENPDIDLVMMDIAMPFMDGYEATRQIRQFNQKVIIIAQTTFVFSADRENAFEAGCNDYITKPFGKAALVELIKKHIKK